MRRRLFTQIYLSFLTVPKDPAYYKARSED